MKAIYHLLLALMLAAMAPQIGHTQQDAPLGAYPKNEIMLTPLMGLINDSKSALYYKRYLIHNQRGYLNARIGTELLYAFDIEYSTGLTERSTGFNWKLGMELGKRVNRTSFYLGLELGNDRYKTNGLMLYPDQGALFKTDRLQSRTFGVRDESVLKVNSLIAFGGIRYELNQQFTLGLEFALGRGWYDAELTYANPSFPFPVFRENFKGALTDFSVNRFITLGYGF